MIDLERLLRIPFVDPEGSFDISPDGKQLAFAWNVTGQWEIYEIALNASDDPRLVSSPKMVSMGPGGKFAPKYSPDGSRLAYSVDFDGGENFHIFVHNRITGQYHDLTPSIYYAIQSNFCWSPDGTQLAFLGDQSGCFDTYIMSASGGDQRLLLANGFPAWNVRWSPDAHYLAVMSEGTGQDYGVYIVPLDGSQLFSISDENGQINALNPAWSPDGTKLAFHSDIVNGFHQIGIFDLSTKKVSWLTAGEANCRAPAWSKDGKKLVYIRALGASDKVVVHPLDSKPQVFQVDTGVHYKPHFTPDGYSVIFVFNNPHYPPDFWMLALTSGALRQLTHSLPVEMADASFVMPQEITYTGMDGTPVPALLFKSEEANENTPAVVVIHGGPSWHFQAEWYPFTIHLASRGWTVLVPNYRGSTGYGRHWQLANRFKLGGVDTDDVTAGVQYLLDNKLADSKRIAVTGRSHGGYLTMSCLTRYPDLWRVGTAVVPFLNWFTGHENSREDLRHWDLENFGNPKDNYDLWYERSPFFFLDQIKAPVQLICGENDPRCPASESVQARDKLLSFGSEVDFVLYEGEGHAFLKIENIVDSELRRVQLFGQSA